MLCIMTLLTQLKSPDSELSKTSNGLKIGWISRKLWSKMFWQCQHCQYSWKALILGFPKLQMDWKSVEYQGSYEPKCAGNVNTVHNTVKKPWFWAFQNFFGLKIGWILRKLWTEMYVEYVRATNAIVFVSTVSTNNIAYTIQCTACFGLCVSSVNKQHSIHNT